MLFSIRSRVLKSQLREYLPTIRLTDTQVLEALALAKSVYSELAAKMSTNEGL